MYVCLFTEIFDLVNKFKFKNGLPPQVASSSRMIQNDQNQYHKPEYNKEYSGQENIDWLLEHYRHGSLPVPQSDIYASYRHPEDENTDELVHMPSMRYRKNHRTKGELLVIDPS